MTGARAENRRATATIRLMAAVWFTGAVLFVSLAALASFRHLLGAYAVPPSFAALTGWAILIAGSAAALRWILWRAVAAAWPPGWYYVAMGGLSAALLLWIAGLTIGGTPIAGLVVLWALAAAEEGITWPLLARRRVARQADTALPTSGLPTSGLPTAGAEVEQRRPRLPPGGREGSDEQPAPGRSNGPASLSQSSSDALSRSSFASPLSSDPGDSSEPSADDGPARADHAEPADSDAVVQQLTRTKSADGREMVVGWLRLPLAPGQRSGVLHVAFCPPLEGRPTIEFEQVEGPSARIKLAQAFAYGARFDVKLTQPAEDADAVVVQFSAARPR